MGGVRGQAQACAPPFTLGACLHPQAAKCCPFISFISVAHKMRFISPFITQGRSSWVFIKRSKPGGVGVLEGAAVIVSVKVDALQAHSEKAPPRSINNSAALTQAESRLWSSSAAHKAPEPCLEHGLCHHLPAEAEENLSILLLPVMGVSQQL